MFKSIAPLSVIISLRFFGLFVVLPVISVYALNLPNATPTLVGIIIGGYALTQMFFQVPFGIMSDKLGRKGTIILGLLLFAIGSIICAVSDNILGLLLGRLLQGAGAIGAVVTAMISDIVKEEQRPKAMALMGGSIAASFALAMVVGPIVGSFLGINYLFYLTAFLALASIIILVKLVPNPPVVTHTYHNDSKLSFLLNSQLIKMNITNFLQKGMMTFAFMMIPIILTKSYGWELSELWKIYFPAMIAGVFAMAPAAILAEKKSKFKEVLLLGIVLFALSYYLIGNSTNQTLFFIGTIIFFVGFNMHEPIMQSLTTKYIKVHEKGKVLGVFNSFGYLGTFIGGFIGGLYFKEIDGSFLQSLNDISMFIVTICIVWLVLIATLPNPMKTKNLYINIKDTNEENYLELDNLNGCIEWYINNSEKVLIVKYETSMTNEGDINKIVSN
ncbi:MULTIDRUG-EFFLUX TRANSPORTER [hydrothermal vent metagenome]|uniref:MULTIDRUG-EFFLUX TRANSPORTER n=1 Tax=hydrothermal vent metagenome TaxID=652676 RepID=A0A3B1EAA6_9ZZZZ